MELKDGKRWAATGAKSHAYECEDPKNNAIKAKGLTIDFNNKDVVTFDAMASVAQVMNTIPIEEQQTLLTKQQLKEKNIEFIQSEPRFMFGYNKKPKTLSH